MKASLILEVSLQGHEAWRIYDNIFRSLVEHTEKHFGERQFTFSIQWLGETGAEFIDLRAHESPLVPLVRPGPSTLRRMLDAGVQIIEGSVRSSILSDDLSGDDAEFEVEILDSSVIVLRTNSPELVADIARGLAVNREAPC